MGNIDFTLFKKYTPSGRRDEIAEVMSVSGGRSSAYTLIMLINGGFGNKKNDIISFQNTGWEDESCYIFVNELEKEIGLPIVWLEYSLTQKFINELILKSFSYDKFFNGEYNSIEEILDVDKLKSFDYKKTPNNFWYKEGYCNNKESCKVVNFETASRNGKPFTDIFLYRCALRIMNGKGLIMPSAGQRWCTGDMKEKILHRWLRNQGIKTYTKYMGMRYDEPIRVNRMFHKSTSQIFYDCPLYWEEITKSDVMQAWTKQTIDLGLKKTGENCFKDFLGNCAHCHLKTKLKKLYLIQNGYSNSLGRQIETIANNYNGDTDAMNRSHGTYEAQEKEAKERGKINIEEVLSDEEIEIQCVGCGD